MVTIWGKFCLNSKNTRKQREYIKIFRKCLLIFKSISVWEDLSYSKVVILSISLVLLLVVSYSTYSETCTYKRAWYKTFFYNDRIYQSSWVTNWSAIFIYENMPFWHRIFFNVKNLTSGATGNLLVLRRTKILNAGWVVVKQWLTS